MYNVNKIKEFTSAPTGNNTGNPNMVGGINIFGYVSGEFSIGTLCRSIMKALETQNVPFSYVRLDTSIQSHNDSSCQKYPQGYNNDFHTNIVVANADCTENTIINSYAHLLRNKYNIAVWSWELDVFPAMWQGAARHYNEIWTISTFCQKAISKVVNIPVIYIPFALDMTEHNSGYGDNLINRLRANDSSTLKIITSFDYFSDFARKNCCAVVDAFKRAFTKNEKAILIIKTIYGQQRPADKQKLINQIAGDPRITVIDETVRKADYYSLLKACDCFISLHRSEGLGYNLLESMYFSKIVIGTNYSGNSEFMNSSNSIPVPYSLVGIEPGSFYHRLGKHWANPDVQYAAQKLLDVYLHRSSYDQMRVNAHSYVRDNHSYAASGRKMVDRLAGVGRNASVSRHVSVSASPGGSHKFPGFMFDIWSSRRDLQGAFPNIDSNSDSRRKLVEWALTYGKQEFQFTGDVVNCLNDYMQGRFPNPSTSAAAPAPPPPPPPPAPPSLAKAQAPQNPNLVATASIASRSNIPRFLVEIWKSRGDLQKAFPNIIDNPTSRKQLINWGLTNGRVEHSLDANAINQLAALH